MAKTPKFSKNTKKRYKQLNQRLSSYLVAVDSLYDALEKDAASLAIASGHTAEAGAFSFSLTAAMKRAFEVLINAYAANLAFAIDRGTKQEWERAEEDHDTFAQEALSAYGANPADSRYARYNNHITDARDSFLAHRREGQHGWSARVWDLRKQTQQDMELAISAAIADGTSASTLATQMKQYLNEPNRLFRRVRNEYGDLVLSKNAAAYHPGAGIYRSSRKNAMRLARTEINMAYRNADIQRYQQEDFVVGFEIKLSGSHPKEDICDKLAGKYPKTFDWTGWHPQDLCYIVPVLKTEDEFFDDDDKPSVNQVDDAPEAFYQYLEDNAERLEAARQRGTLPYWIEDNFTVYRGGEMVANFVESKYGAPMNTEDVFEAKREQNREANEPIIANTDDCEGRLKIHPYADNTEIEKNITCAQSMLGSFEGMRIEVREHVYSQQGVKNPEYSIDGLIADRKGIQTEKGVANAFQKAIAQGCKAVVIDLDDRMEGQILRTNKLAGKIMGRREDFLEERIKACYVVHNKQAVRITAEAFNAEDNQEVRARIISILSKMAE